MKAIRVHYESATKTRPARFIADDSDGNRAIVSADEGGADSAARNLCDLMGWRGTLVNGSWGNASFYVWVECLGELRV